MTAFHRSARWVKFRSQVRPMIQATLPAPCIEGCGRMVQVGDAWDVAHIISYHRDPFQPLTPESVGPAHRGCNRRAGGREGRAKQLRTKTADQRLPEEGSGW